jgi:type I restriction enzyme S subunit
MNATQLLAHFDRLAEAPNAVPRLRRFILDLAVRGKLVAQDAGDEPAEVLLKRIHSRVRKSLAPKKSNQQVDAPDAEVDPPFELPPSWMWTRLFELGRTQTGATPSKNAGEIYGNHMPFLKPGDLLPSHVDYSGEGLSELGLKDSGRFTPAGSLLMVCIGTIGKCQLVDRACSFNQQINSIAPYDGLESRFLLAVFMSESFQSAAWTASAKTTIAILNKGKWEQLPVPLPPLAEQHRIVAKVDELMTLCDQLEAAQLERERRRDRLAAASVQRLNQPAADTTPEAQREHARFHLHHLSRLTTRPEQLKMLRQTILQLALSGLLVTQCAEDETAHDFLQRIGLDALSKKYPTRKRTSQVTELLDLQKFPFPLPSSWKWTYLGDLLDVTSSKRIFESEYVLEGVPFYRSKEIGELAKTGTTFSSFFISDDRYRELKSSTDFPKSGDLLMTSVGSIGNTWLVDERQFYFKDGNVTQLIKRNGMNMRFVQQFIASPLFIDAVAATVAGTAYNALTIVKIKRLIFPLPPLAEQHRIVAKVDELMALCDQLEAQLTSTQTDSRRLLEAVLEAALTSV